MPVYTYELSDGTTGSVYASNVFEAEDEVFAIQGDHPERLTEAE